MVSGSRLERLLRQGEFVVCGEMSPPQGADKASILKKCEYFRGYVDAVNLTDNQTAIVRMSSVMSSVFVIEGGCEPVMQMTCRDRNRLAQQSDLLGAYAAGIRNVLCLTGDYQSFGNHPEAKGVFDLDSVQLIHAVADMNAGKFMSGEEIKPPPAFFIGGAANPFAEPLDLRIIRLGKKIAAGCHFIQTQPVFDWPRFEKWMSLVRDEGLDQQVFILVGVMPVRSVKALTYMRDEVPGMSIAEEYIKRMESAQDPKEEGVKICVELIKRLRETPGVKGVHIMPVMWESITPRLVEEAGLLPRPEPITIEEPAEPEPAETTKDA
ncbi:MAG: methylenetetrahydrofolate reductase [Armatimonadetes bacterium]|nr:methylenetetrahydrofolate reductase [Armatimonadota bacterium]